MGSLTAISKVDVRVYQVFDRKRYAIEGANFTVKGWEKGKREE